MPQKSSEQRQQHAALRASGLRLVKIWVPDVNRPGFAEECARQARLAAAADRMDTSLVDELETALHDLEAWTA
jgi:hypothetical protein